MDRLREMEVFVAVAESGGFAKAAQRLRISPPAVTRLINGLEERLGVRLLTRTTRRVALSDAGSAFLERCQRLLAELGEAERIAGGASLEPSGRLTVTASVSLGRMHVAPVIASFVRAHPRVSASLLLLDRVANLIEEGIDVAVRVGHLSDSSLVARQIGHVRRVFVASPDYIARSGAPATPLDLKHHDLIAFTGLLPNSEWRYAQNGRSKGVTLAARFEINDAQAAIKSAAAGDGVTIALSYMVDKELKAGRLVPVLADFWPEPAPVSLVYPAGRAAPAKLRAFVDFAAPRFKARLAGVVGAP